MEMLDPSDPVFVTGSPEDQKRARAEWYRQRFIAEVMKSQLREIPRSRLDFGRYAITDTTTGDLYRANPGGSHDLNFTSAVAYYLTATGEPILLELPSGPKTVDELERQKAAREQDAAARRRPRAR